MCTCGIAIAMQQATPASISKICYVIAPDPVLLRAHGSFLTPRWREPDSNCWYYQRQPTATDAPPGILVFEDGRLPPEQRSEFALDSLLEQAGFELVWGFSCQVVVF